VPTKQDFETELRRQLAHAHNLGKAHLDVNAGELHRDVGGYPSSDHRMPVCCDTMIEEMKNQNDRILAQPPKGRGASLTIRYRLPR
jgi:5-methylcytosine-specific restriction protein A